MLLNNNKKLIEQLTLLFNWYVENSVNNYLSLDYKSYTKDNLYIELIGIDTNYITISNNKELLYINYSNIKYFIEDSGSYYQLVILGISDYVIPKLSLLKNLEDF